MLAITTASSAYSATSQTITFTQSAAGVTTDPVAAAFAYLIDATGARFGADIPVTTVPVDPATTPKTFTIDGKNLARGKYSFKVFYTGKGYGKLSNALTITSAAPTIAAVVTGYNGGAEIKVVGTGLNLETKALIGGRTYAEIDTTQSTKSLLVYKAPPYYSKLVQETYGTLKEQKLTGAHVGDKAGEIEKAFDGKTATAYQSNGFSNIYLGIDLGTQKKAVVTRVKYNYNTIASHALKDAKIVGSNDNTAWDTLYTFATEPLPGWGQWAPTTLDYKSYRYIQIRR